MSSSGCHSLCQLSAQMVPYSLGIRVTQSQGWHLYPVGSSLPFLHPDSPTESPKSSSYHPLHQRGSLFRKLRGGIASPLEVFSAYVNTARISILILRILRESSNYCYNNPKAGILSSLHVCDPPRTIVICSTGHKHS